MTKKQSVSMPKLLQRQQQIVRKATRRDFIGALGIVVIIFIVVLCVLLRHEAINTKLLPLVCLPLFAAALVLLLSGLSHRRLLLQLEQVDSPKEERVSILCKKVKFMLQQSRHASRSYWIVCIVLLDEQGERYYYVQSKSLHQSLQKNLRARYLDKELALICYHGTRLVKELPQEISKNFEKVEKNT